MPEGRASRLLGSLNGCVVFERTRDVCFPPRGRRSTPPSPDRPFRVGGPSRSSDARQPKIQAEMQDREGTAPAGPGVELAVSNAVSLDGRGHHAAAGRANTRITKHGSEEKQQRRAPSRPVIPYTTQTSPVLPTSTSALHHDNVARLYTI